MPWIARSVGVSPYLAEEIRSERTNRMNGRKPHQVKLHTIPHSAFDGIYDVGGKAELMNVDWEP